ncbi:MAG TPA: hypothetical protein VFK54_04715 [Candidatus Limnocylindrales bacterium]|nr:hypothetical protein [Candidatus Limnocylindrales bacterium]
MRRGSVTRAEVTRRIPSAMPDHAATDASEPLIRGLGPGETIWSVVRSPAEVLVGTDRRLFRLSEDRVDEWTYTAVNAIYGIDGSHLFLVVAGTDSFPVRIPPGPDHERAIQELAVLALLVGLAHRGDPPADDTASGQASGA